MPTCCAYQTSGKVAPESTCPKAAPMRPRADELADAAEIWLIPPPPGPHQAWPELIADAPRPLDWAKADNSVCRADGAYERRASPLPRRPYCRLIDRVGPYVGHIAFFTCPLPIRLYRGQLRLLAVARLFEGHPAAVWTAAKKLNALPADIHHNCSRPRIHTVEAKLPRR